MCLFNRDIQDMSCGHEECKNFYILNKQMCMYNNSQPSLSNPLKPTQNPLPQITTPTSQRSSSNFPIPQEINTKRPNLSLSDPNRKDSEPSLPNKIIKTDNKDKSNGALQKSKSETQRTQPKGPEMSQFAGPSPNINTSGDKNLLNAILMLQNPQAPPGNFKPDTNMQVMNNPHLLLSLIQNPQPNVSLNPQIQGITGPQQTGLNPMAFSQLLGQNLGVKGEVMGTEMGFGGGQRGLSPDSMNFSPMTAASLFNDMKVKSENGSVVDGFLKEFQGRILELLFQQNKMLVDLKEKNDILQETLACLITEINTIKSSTKKMGKDSAVTGASSSLGHHQIVGSNAESVSVEDLTTFLYGPSPDFQYQLILKSDLPLPLYRERNFKFTVILTDKNGNIVENSNKIPLTLGLYSSENPPKYIDANTAGNKILKGFIEKDLMNGSATFEKIQIKEVTSHFRNGWVFFVVYPKVTNSANLNNILMTSSGTIVSGDKIKPLVLEKVIVKAKKAKEKEQAASEVNDQEESKSVKNEENQTENDSKE